MNWKEYIPGSSRYESSEREEISRISSEKVLQNMLLRYEAGLRQFPEGEGNAIFSRLKAEALEKMTHIHTLKKEVKIESTRSRSSEQGKIQRNLLKQDIQRQINQAWEVRPSEWTENYSNEWRAVPVKKEYILVNSWANNSASSVPLEASQAMKKRQPWFREWFQDGVERVFSIFR